MADLVSVIIPTHNSQSTIEQCLSSLKKQKYRPLEIIIVDEDSTDLTLEICKRYKTKVINKPWVGYYTPPAASRNIGAAHSRGKFLFHLDSDMVVGKNTIANCVKKLNADRLDALIVHEIDVASGYWSRVKALERSCYINEEGMEYARFVRRTLFFKVNGYQEGISTGEDRLIHAKYKKYGSVGNSDEWIYHYLPKISILNHIKKWFNYGRSVRQYFKLGFETPQGITLKLCKTYIKNWKKFCAEPQLILGFLWLRSIEGISAWLGGLFDRFLANKQAGQAGIRVRSKKFGQQVVNIRKKRK